ncbi:methionine--tRNA ligase subunit beta [Candidatus Woesearchaeota archaeon]|nr:methionine--tRNA ligase subunit beta [Candidatus Woesearchaeota archaeon]
METIKFDDWKKIDLRVGEIKEVNNHPNADKLILLKVDLGDKIINLVAGIKNFYSEEDLIGKKIIVFTNLEPATIRGIKSEGMLLAAEDSKNNIVSLLTTDQDVKNGSIIR